MVEKVAKSKGVGRTWAIVFALTTTVALGAARYLY
jgi:hypothetical protein